MRVSMRSCGRLRKGLLIMALLLCMTVQTAFAAEGGNEKEYTYTVTLSAGNQGTFNGTGGVHVIGGSAQISGGGCHQDYRTESRRCGGAGCNCWNG